MDSTLRDFIHSLGASDCGATAVDDGPSGLPYAVSVVIRLSDAIVDEISDTPTYTYFNHYRSVNALIDHILLRAGLELQSRGARYLTVAASQSRPDSPYEARYSHKKAACLAGLGRIGDNNLFLHGAWGARVRLGTVFTDWSGCAVSDDANRSSEPDARRRPGDDFPLSASVSSVDAFPSCETCGLCIAACPAGAIHSEGQRDRDGVSRAGFNAKACSDWMKREYQHIGRGSVCGICMKVCPAGTQKEPHYGY